MMRRVLIVNVFLLAIVAVLVLQIAALWWPTEPVSESGGARASAKRRLDLPNPRRPAAPADLAKTIAEKDLFDGSRSAPSAAQQAAADAPPKVLSTVVLIGVAGFGEMREALVRDQASPKAVWVRLGEEVGGYEVHQINTRSLQLQAPSGEAVMVELNVITTTKGPAKGSLTGPAGLVPTPKKTPDRRARRTPAKRSAEIKAKIERLRAEARKRRARNQRNH